MRPILILVSAIALLGVCGCAGAYVGGDLGQGVEPHRNLVAAALPDR